MNEEKARTILGSTIKDNNSLYNGAQYIEWKGVGWSVVLDGMYGYTELEAVVWWMQNMKVTK